MLQSLLRTSALSLIVLGCAGAAATPSPAPVVDDIPDQLPLELTPRPTSAAITASDLMTRMYIVADDSMEGREAGTAGNVRATDYIARELRRMGVDPAGENGTYFQTIPLVGFGLDSAVLEVDGQMLRQGVDWQGYAAIAGYTGGAFLPFVRGGSVPIVYGGVVGDTAAMASPEQVAGAIVIMTPRRDPSGQLSSTVGPALPLIAQRYGSAAAVAFATLDLYPPQVAASLAGPVTTMSNPSRVTSGRPGWLFLSQAAAERLLGIPIDQAKAGPTGRRARVSITFAEKPLDTPARNVIGVVRGSDPERRNQYVAIGAHNDHVGIRDQGPIEHDSLKAFNRVLRPEGAEAAPRVATDADWVRIRAMIDSMRALRPPRPDSIFNGADDDGSGTVALLEVAEAIAAQPVKPRRSVIFVWHTGEELGLHGARHFTAHPTVPRDSIVAQINLDMVGRGAADDTPGGGPNYLQLLGSRRLSTGFGQMVDSVARSAPHGFALDYQFDAPGHPNQFYCRSDHYMYARYGIPIVFFSTGGHQDYHMLTDEAQYIDYAHLGKVTRFVRDLATAVANQDARPLVDQPVPDIGAPCRQ